MDYLGPYLLGPNDKNQGIYTGDAQKNAMAIPNNSIDVVFSDPVYDNMEHYRWLAWISSKVLRPGGDLLTYFAHYHLKGVINAIGEFLDYRWLLVEKNMQGGGNMQRIWTYELNTLYSPLLWYSKGSPRRGAFMRRDYVLRLPGKLNHKWAKGESGVRSWIEHFTAPQDIILDPFCGGGTIPAMCKMLGRRWLAFEIDPDVAERARERVRMTQPPLFVSEPEQLSFLQKTEP